MPPKGPSIPRNVLKTQGVAQSRAGSKALGIGASLVNTSKGLRAADTAKLQSENAFVAKGVRSYKAHKKDPWDK